MRINFLFIIFSLLSIFSDAQSTTMIRTLLESYSSAKCIDGSPAAYYFTPGVDDGVDKWFIWFQGGGWCTSLENCYERSLGVLGSSKTDPPTKDLPGTGYFSADPTLNPLMHNWNKVELRYCDGGSYSGHASVPYNSSVTLHFHGYANLMSTYNDLYENKKLNMATDVVLSGCSAGGLATYLHLDDLAVFLHNQPRNPTVVGLPDSGYFMALDFPENGKTYRSDMKWVWETMKSWNGTNSNCNNAYKLTDSWKCIFAQYVSPFIGTPIFALQSEYDAWQIPEILGSENPDLINKFGANLTLSMKEDFFENKNFEDHKAFLDSCRHHCGNEWNKIQINGKTQQQAFSEFYENVKAAKTYMQGKKYLCTACCN